MIPKMNLVVKVPPMKGDLTRHILRELCSNDPKRRLKHLREESKVAVPVLLPDDLNTEKLKEDLIARLDCELNEIEVKQMSMPAAKNLTIQSPHQLIVDAMKKLLTESGCDWKAEIEADIASQWEKHGDILLINNEAFNHPVWARIGAKVWQTVAECLSCSRVARNSAISTDGYRQPQVTLLYGITGRTEHVDNGIRYTYDVTKCMFSSGNITEKLRVSKFNCKDEVVVDLYAGIGYFTLPYLVYTGVKHVHACDWNPYAIDALRRNLKLNDVEDRCTVLRGNNKNVCPRGVADRVNLGLIPSSRAGWPVACAALKTDTGGILHIHYNVNTKPGSKYCIFPKANKDDANSGTKDNATSGTKDETSSSAKAETNKDDANSGTKDDTDSGTKDDASSGAKAETNKDDTNSGIKDDTSNETKVDTRNGIKVDTRNGTTVDTSNGTTVDTSNGSTVDTSNGTKVDTSSGTKVDTSNGTKVDTSNGTTVDTSSGTKVDTSSGTKVDTSSGTKVDTSNGTMVDTSNGTKVDTSNGTKVDTSNGTKVDTSNGKMVDTSNGKMVDTSNGTKVDTSNGKMVDSSNGTKVDTSSGTTVDTSNGTKAHRNDAKRKSEDCPSPNNSSNAIRTKLNGTHRDQDTNGFHEELNDQCLSYCGTKDCVEKTASAITDVTKCSDMEVVNEDMCSETPPEYGSIQHEAKLPDVDGFTQPADRIKAHVENIVKSTKCADFPQEYMQHSLDEETTENGCFSDSEKDGKPSIMESGSCYEQSLNGDLDRCPEQSLNGDLDRCSEQSLNGHLYTCPEQSLNGDLDRCSEQSLNGDLDRCSEQSLNGHLDTCPEQSLNGDLDTCSEQSLNGDLDRCSEQSLNGDLDTCSEQSLNGHLDTCPEQSLNGDLDRWSEQSLNGHLDRCSEQSLNGHLDRCSEQSLNGDLDRCSEHSLNGDLDRCSEQSLNGDLDRCHEQSLNGHLDRCSEQSLNGDLDTCPEQSLNGDFDQTENTCIFDTNSNADPTEDAATDPRISAFQHQLYERLMQMKNRKWLPWAMQAAYEVKAILETHHCSNIWVAEILHIEHVKSYAPHIDHVVLDLKCFPLSTLLQ